ncbi:MAG: type I-B CRISPR-associated protein Cas7/Cst2/DevR [Desulfobacca sp.]|nr:type I-B CRISPR-associated protein Cas7/Cst2/DevR [Desulfobacca sp.]
MSLHIFGAMVTAPGCAANNRGETEGNITTLQKILWQDQVHTTVSAEAIRWALRYYWQMNNQEVNRRWVDDKEDHVWQDPDWRGWSEANGKIYLDDDLLGFMRAEGAKLEAEGEAPAQKGKRPKGTVNKRRGVLEITRAISTTPYAGDISFNAKSGEKGRTSLYGTEMHATRYQYGFALTPERLREKTRCLDALDGLVNLGEVAGNHSRFLFDFSPESVILRVTPDPAPRLLYCFQEENGSIITPELVRKVKAGDIDPKELYIGGLIAQLPDIQELQAKICNPGVKKVLENCKSDVSAQLGL